MILQSLLISKLLLLLLELELVKASYCTTGDIRLVDGNTAREGRVDICYSRNNWYSVCNDNWGTNEARVVCRELGYCSDGGTAIDGYPRNYPYDYKHIECQGTETSLSSCSVTDNNNCFDVAGVRCILEVPNVPGSITVRVANSYTVQVAWTQPNISGCRDVENYQISCSVLIDYIGICDQDTPTLVDSTTYSYSVINFDLDYVIYNCCVWASNSAGSGPQQYALALNAPMPSASAINMTSILITWSTPYNYYYRFDINQYNVYYRESNCSSCATMQVRATSSGSSTARITISNLWPGTQYQFQISAIITTAESARSGYMYATTVEAPPTATRNVRITEKTSTSLQIDWLAPEYTNGTVTYIIHCSNPNYNQERTTDGVSYTMRNLQVFAFYKCCVTARNNAGDSRRSCVSERTSQVMAENVQVIVNSSTQITISWDQPSYQERSAQPLHYRIQICNVTYEQPDCKDQITTGNTYYLNIRLHPYYRYMLTVAAYTSTMGYGPPSEVISIQMPEDVPSAPPQNTRYKVLSSSEIKLSWGPPPLDQQNGVIIGYLVRVLTANNRKLYTITVSYSEFTVTSLKEHTSYNFEVATKTQIGVGPFYRYNTVTTLYSLTFGLSVTAGLVGLFLLVLIICVIIICCCFRKEIKQSNAREELHVTEDLTMNNLTTPQTQRNVLKLNPTVQQEQVTGSHWKNNRVKTRSAAAVNETEIAEVESDNSEHPQLPHRHYIDDMDFMQENRYIDTISLATELSEDPPEIPPRTYLQDTKFNQELQTAGNLPQTPVPGQDTEKIYQPLIPPIRYEENYQEPSSEYQLLTFRGAANNDPKSVHQSDKEPQLINHSEGQYQALTKREEESIYEPLSIVKSET